MDDGVSQQQANLQEEEMMHMEAPKVYAAIAKVTGAMATEGIGKNRNNSQQGYKFRGIDDVFNALSRHLSSAGLCMLPRVVDRAVTERSTKNGGVLFYTVLTMDFELVSAEDGSKHVIRTIGEAMDSADKSSNKAMSAAYKYAALQAFCIPTEGDNDADATTHEVAALTEAEQNALQVLRDASLNGTDALQLAWQAAGKQMRLRLAGELDSLKKAAAQARKAA